MCNMGDFFRDGGPPPRKVKKCQVLIQYKGTDSSGDIFNKPREEARSPADDLNHIIWKGYIPVNYLASRARHVADGVWGPWEEWSDKDEQRPYNFERLWKKNGKWFEEIGPDVYKYGGSIGELVEEKPSCVDISNPASHTGIRPAITPPVAPLARIQQSLSKIKKIRQVEHPDILLTIAMPER